MKGQHVNSRKLAGASAASVGAATAVAALLLGTLSGSAGEQPTASAFGLAADGLLPIAPTPKVEAPPDDRKALLEVPGPDGKGGIYVALLKVEAEKFRSKATAVDVREHWEYEKDHIAGARLIPLARIIGKIKSRANSSCKSST